MIDHQCCVIIRRSPNFLDSETPSICPTDPDRRKEIGYSQPVSESSSLRPFQADGELREVVSHVITLCADPFSGLAGPTPRYSAISLAMMLWSRLQIQCPGWKKWLPARLFSRKTLMSTEYIAREMPGPMMDPNQCNWCPKIIKHENQRLGCLRSCWPLFDHSKIGLTVMP